MTLQAEIKSKDCKSQKHKSCAGHWTGLGIEVVCDCECHEKVGLGPQERNQAQHQTGTGPLFEVSQNNSYIRE